MRESAYTILEIIQRVIYNISYSSSSKVIDRLVILDLEQGANKRYTVVVKLVGYDWWSIDYKLGPGSIDKVQMSDMFISSLI